MQFAITFMTVVAGLVFSIGVALVVEELIFGQVFRLFFSPQAKSPTHPILPYWSAQPTRIRAEQQH